MKIEILTLFPEMFGGVLGSSILKRAQDGGLVSIGVRNIRDYTTDKHHVTDDTPYGGGPGMVMKPEPIVAAFDAIAASAPDTRYVRIYLSPDGETWNQRLAEEMARADGMVLLCGHYEGIDERVRELCIDREISIGDYVLTGGEVPAMAVVDSVVRLLPGVLGNADSVVSESFGEHGFFDHPHYTRPEDFRGMRVPEILLSGHHRRIDEWRRMRAIERTLARRPELIDACRDKLTKAELKLIGELTSEPRLPSE